MADIRGFLDALRMNRERIYAKFGAEHNGDGRVSPETIDELIRLARIGLATERNSRDLSQLHRVLDWLARENGERMTVDYCEGEVRVTLDTRGAKGKLVAIGKASDFAGAVDIAESEGWSP